MKEVYQKTIIIQKEIHIQLEKENQIYLNFVI